MMNKREIRKELNKILKGLEEPFLRVTNYHFEDDGMYSNDIEIQVWDGDEYMDCITIDSIEVENFDRKNFGDMAIMQDKACLKTKKDIFKWLTNNYDGDTFGIELALKGYWA